MADESSDGISSSATPSTSGESGSSYHPPSYRRKGKEPVPDLPPRTLRPRNPPRAPSPSSSPDPIDLVSSQSPTSEGTQSPQDQDGGEDEEQDTESGQEDGVGSGLVTATTSGAGVQPDESTEEETFEALQHSGEGQEGEENNPQNRQHPNPHLNPNYPFSDEEPSYFVTGGGQEPDGTTEEATSQESKESSQGEDQEQPQEHPNLQLNPDYPFDAGSPSDFVTGEQESDEATEEVTEEGTSKSQQEDPNGPDNEAQDQQYPNPHLNPNYPYNANSPLDFVTGGQASDEATEKETELATSESQEQADEAQAEEQLPDPNPDNASNADEVLEFVVEPEPPSTPATVEIALSERSQDQSQDGDANQYFVVEPELPSSPSTAEISLPSGASQDQSEDQDQEDVGDTSIASSSDSNSDSEPEDNQDSEQDRDQGPNQGSEQEQESDSGTGQGDELSSELEDENESEDQESVSPSDDVIIVEEEISTPTTVSTELLVWPDAEPELNQEPYRYKGYATAPDVEPAPPTPTTVSSVLLIFSEEPRSDIEQTEQQTQKVIEHVQEEDHTQVVKEEAKEQDEEDDEPFPGTKRKSRAQAPTPEPQPKRQQTSRSRRSLRQGTISRVAKRKAIGAQASPSKKVKTSQDKGKSRDGSTRPKPMNNAPTELLDVYVCGLNTDGQLGLGHSKNNAIQPMRNPYLSKKKAGVVQVAAGGAHCGALTHDNKILTWGANYDGQLGRRTRNLEDDEYPLAPGVRPNKEETVPREVDFSQASLPDDTVFTQVVATDSATFVLTEFGDVYGWGTFRDNRSKLKEKTRGVINPDNSDYEDGGDDDDDESGREPIIGFSPFHDVCQLTPVKIEGLRHITSLATGAQHVLARHFRGSVYAWGAASRDQLGRKKLKRPGCAHPHLIPRVCIFPGNNSRSGYYGITEIGAGGHHSFAIKKNGEVYSWGWNMYGQTGIPEEESESSDSYLEWEATVPQPSLVPELQGEEAISVTGGLKHSIAVTKDNRCLSWGAIQGNALGIPDKDIDTNHVHSTEDGSVDEILGAPGLVTGIQGKVTSAAAGASHSLAIAGKRTVFGWGSNDEYEIGQRHKKDVDSATVIEGGELKGAAIVAAVAGLQFTILLAE